jgi:hypothetical protein
MISNKEYVRGLCAGYSELWALDQLADDLDERDARIAELKATLIEYKDNECRAVALWADFMSSAHAAPSHNKAEGEALKHIEQLEAEINGLRVELDDANAMIQMLMLEQSDD